MSRQSSHAADQLRSLSHLFEFSAPPFRRLPCVLTVMFRGYGEQPSWHRSSGGRDSVSSFPTPRSPVLNSSPLKPRAPPALDALPTRQETDRVYHRKTASLLPAGRERVEGGRGGIRPELSPPLTGREEFPGARKPPITSLKLDTSASGTRGQGTSGDRFDKSGSYDFDREGVDVSPTAASQSPRPLRPESSQYKRNVSR